MSLGKEKERFGSVYRLVEYRYLVHYRTGSPMPLKGRLN